MREYWEKHYKTEPQRAQTASPEPESRPSYLEEMLNEFLPSGPAIPRPTLRQDQLALCLAEPRNNNISAMDYWKSREEAWPQLAAMAFDLFAVPAMSAECERVFSSCAKQTTKESSRLSVETLWRQECLKNWQFRGAIEIEMAYHAIRLDWEEGE